jgi:MoaA/NifB/PqqE/SkfB family radical SAM enzyme
MAQVSTIDFHVTGRCNQECPYCWGPSTDMPEVGTSEACAIVRRIAETGARRIVFTGGDPVLREDLGPLIRLAKELELEVAVSSTGDRLTPGFLRAYGRWIDLISLPLDGPNEQISSRTKRPGHFTAVLRAMVWLADYAEIDVKIGTPVTRKNLESIPELVDLIERITSQMPNRAFLNLFQAYPRSMGEVDWSDLLVSDAEFAALRLRLEARVARLKVNWLDHATLDRLYVMVMPDGSMTIPSGPAYPDYGRFVDITDLALILTQAEFDLAKHIRHARGWARKSRRISSPAQD